MNENYYTLFFLNILFFLIRASSVERDDASNKLESVENERNLVIK